MEVDLPRVANRSIEEKGNGMMRRWGVGCEVLEQFLFLVSPTPEASEASEASQASKTPTLPTPSRDMSILLKEGSV